MTDTRGETSTAILTQRNRRLLLSLPACALSLLSACGGSSSPPAANTTPGVPNPPVAPNPSVAPTALRYDTDQPLYQLGDPITPNNAHVTGGTTPTFSVAPALPVGLQLDTITGAISGTPTSLQRQATYTLSAGNGAGAVHTQVRITVTGRGAWSTVATIPGARHDATLSKLPDGRFLVAGGTIDGGGATDSVQIYDPVSSSWSTAAPMLAARTKHLAITVGTGQVLVFGGVVANADTNTAELYDPATNSWAVTGSMNDPRSQATAHLLANGKVMVIGGYVAAPPGAYLDGAELYDPLTQTWTKMLTRMSVPRSLHASALLPGGTTLLVAGGYNGSGFVTTAELFAVDDSGTTVIAYGVTSSRHRAVALDDGSVLVVSDGNSLSRRFDPLTSTWTTSAMSAARQLPSMIALADGRVLLVSGRTLTTAEVYNPDVNIWTPAGSMSVRRWDGVAALRSDGSVLMISGSSSVNNVNSSELYTP